MLLSFVLFARINRLEPSNRALFPLSSSSPLRRPEYVATAMEDRMKAADWLPPLGRKGRQSGELHSVGKHTDWLRLLLQVDPLRASGRSLVKSNEIRNRQNQILDQRTCRKT